MNSVPQQSTEVEQTLTCLSNSHVSESSYAVSRWDEAR